MSAASNLPADPKGWSEIAVRDDLGKVIAIVTRPCAGASWFLHLAGSSSCRGIKFKTRKAALSAAGGK